MKNSMASVQLDVIGMLRTPFVRQDGSFTSCSLAIATGDDYCADLYELTVNG